MADTVTSMALANLLSDLAQYQRHVAVALPRAGWLRSAGAAPHGPEP